MATAVTGFKSSPQQRRIWRLAGAGGSYAVERRLRLAPGWTEEGLREALEASVRRHPALRTALRRPTGMKSPLQVVEETAVVGWRTMPVEGSGAAGCPEEALEEISRTERAAAFDLDTGPWLRAAVLVGSEGPVAVLLIAAAVAADGPAMDRLAAELRAASPESEKSGTAAAAGAPVPYVQFSEWQGRTLDERPDDDPELAGWNRALEQGEGARLLGEARAAGEEAQTGAFPEPLRLRRVLEAGAPAAAALAAGGEAEAALLAAWLVLLRRLDDGARSGDAVVTAVAAPGRVFPGLEGLVGPADRFVPAAVRLGGDFTFAEVRRRAADALAHARRNSPLFSWERLGRGAAPESPLPFAFEPEGEETPDEVDRWSRREAHRLRLAVRRRPAGDGAAWVLDLYADPRRFPAPEAELVLERFAAILTQGLDDPERKIGELDLSLEADRQARTALWARPPASEEAGLPTVPELFARAAAANPEGVALRAGDTELTYRRLRRAAADLAARLRAAGVGPEARVGIPGDRSAGAIVALLAVMEAGGAYVPIDPTLPAERRARIAAAAGLGARVVPAGTGARAEAEAADGAVVVELPADLGSEAAGDAPAPLSSSPAGPENLAYLLFTSGSTGAPKGVAVEHRQLSAYLAAATERLPLDGIASYASVSTLAADLGHTVVFPALTRGASLHLLPQEVLADPAALADYRERHGLDAMKIVPSHLEALTATDRPGAVLPAKLLVLGGEAAGRALLRRLTEHLPEGCAVFNHYGPTETTVGVAAGRVSRAELETAAREGASGGSLPLGEPLLGAELHLLDSRLRPVLLREPGEMVVGGAGVSRGYPGRPAETAERFVPDPFSGRPGARLYRTGDRVRLAPGEGREEGTGEPTGAGKLRLEFLGRIDNQVKIRGNRVETGEIAALLAAHPDVRDGVVVPRRSPLPGRADELVAYYVPAPGRAVDAAGLQRHLEGHLAAFMVPSALVPLEALPLNANGKLDVRALPDPSTVDLRAGRELVPPRDDLDRLLAGMWREVLRLDEVGIDDDFFAVGGHSLLAMQLLWRLRRTFGFELPMRALFDAPTIRTLADELPRHEPTPGLVGKVAAATARLDALSDEEVEALLARREAAGAGKEAP